MARKRKRPARKRQPRTPPHRAPDVGGPAASEADDGYKVGPGRPPKEYQFKPGESGNPHGQPRHRTHLWTHYCKFLAMTAEQLRRVNRAELSLAERSALRLAIATAKGKRCSSERLARYSVDRDEGRAVEHIVVGEEEALTDAECEELRNVILQNQAGKPDGNDTD
jgi:hypothetical protein